MFEKLIALLLAAALAGGAPAAQVPEAPAPEAAPPAAAEAEPAGALPVGWHWERVVFPAYQEGRTDYNARIYDAAPFTAALALPEGWTVRTPAPGERADPTADLFTRVDLLDGERVIGYLGYNTFELYPDTTPENFHRMVYNQLMLGSIVSWDVDYTPVRKAASAETATCKVRVQDMKPGQVAAEAETIYFPAILSYDAELLCYVGLRFDRGAVDEGRLTNIAKSIRLSPI